MAYRLTSHGHDAARIEATLRYVLFVVVAAVTAFPVGAQCPGAHVQSEDADGNFHGMVCEPEGGCPDAAVDALCPAAMIQADMAASATCAARNQCPDDDACVVVLPSDRATCASICTTANGGIACNVSYLEVYDCACARDVPALSYWGVAACGLGLAVASALMIRRALKHA